MTLNQKQQSYCTVCNTHALSVAHEKVGVCWYLGTVKSPSKTLLRAVRYMCLRTPLTNWETNTFRKCLLIHFSCFSLSGGWSPTGSTRHGGYWLAYYSLPRVIMMMENFVEWRLARETEVLGENPPQRHFVHQFSCYYLVYFSKCSRHYIARNLVIYADV
jgi:hypothetical protein